MINNILFDRIAKLEDKELAKEILSSFIESLSSSKYFANWKLSYMENNFDMNNDELIEYNDDNKEYSRILRSLQSCIEAFDKLTSKKKKSK